GYSREEVIGRTPEELKLSADLQQDGILQEQLRKYGRVEGFEFHYRTKPGKVGITLLSVELVELDGQQRVLSITKDISDRKELELALQASQTQINDILNSAIAAISSFRVSVDKNWKINYISAGCEFVSGYTSAELQTDKNIWNSRIFPGDWQGIESQIYADIFAQQTGTYEYRLYHKNGSLRWISQTNSSRWDATLNCWIVTSVSLDITDRKQAEEQLHKTERWLRHYSNQSPSTIFTAVQELDGRIWFEYISSAVEAIHEVTDAQILENSQLLFDQFHPDDVASYNDAVARSSQNLEVFSLEWRIITPSGKVKWLQANSQPERRSNGAIAWHGVVLDITDRKQAEEQLHKTERWLRHYSNQSPSSIYTLVQELDGRVWFEYNSSAVETIHELTYLQIIENPQLIFDQFHPDDVASYNDAVARSSQNLELFSHEWRIITPSGKVKWLQANSQPERRSNGAIAWHGVISEITDRKQVQEALRQSEERFQQLAAASPGVIYTVIEYPTGPALYEYLSPAFEEIHEIPVAEVIQDAAITFNQIHPDDRLGYQQAVTESLETERPFKHEWRIITPSGKQKWIQANSRSQRRENGEIAWHGVVLDITEQKQTEQALQQALQHIDTHFDECPLAILQWDQNFRILRWSKQAEHIFGWTTEEVKTLSWQSKQKKEEKENSVRADLVNNLGQPKGNLAKSVPTTQNPKLSESLIPWKLVYDEDLDRVNAEIAPLMKGLISSKAVQNRNYTKDGRVIVCQWYSSVVFDEAGNLVSVLSFAQDITDRQQAESELRQQKELRETIFNESTDAIFLVDPQTRLIIDCNRRAVELFEVESKIELIGKEAQILQSRPFTDKELEQVSQEIRHKGFWSMELEYISRQGNIFWGNVAANPVQIANKAITLVRVTDISNRKKIEAALQESEQTNRILVQSIPDLLIRMSRNGTYLDVWTSEGIKLLNQAKFKLGASIFDVLPLEIAQERFHLIQTTLATGKVQIQEYQLEIEKEIHYEEARIVPYGVDDVLIFVRDVTDRKSIEAALRESEERFRRAFDDAAIGMALVGLDGRFLQVNLALCEITGYNETELLGNFFQDITHPDDLNPDLEYIRQVLTGKRRTYQMEKRYIHKFGHLVWGLLGVSVVKDQQGNCLYFVTQVQDISERHKIDRIKDEFISIVSHELRTPLTAIRGSLGILETGVLDNRPEKAKYMLEVAVKNSDRLVRLVNDILDLERLQSGKVQLVMENCQVADLMLQAVESVQPIANQAGIKLEVTHLVAEIVASTDAIIQALTNLLSNAIKFSPTHSTIWLSAQLRNSEPQTAENPTVDCSPPSAPYILFEVKDQGRGIPADKLETVFGRFQQIDISDSRQKGGTGLGLAICKSIVQQHGGQIWVESTLGQGSIFYFTLPITRRKHE
ncbi:MAG: PAS domain S-box protein, partial [Phormidium sp.]